MMVESDWWRVISDQYRDLDVIMPMCMDMSVIQSLYELANRSGYHMPFGQQFSIAIDFDSAIRQPVK